jgi:hypothetical protein
MAEVVDEFVARLREAVAGLDAAREKLAAAAVHDAAFGKLFEARAVHDAYRQRLPDVGRDVDSAREVLGHFIEGLVGDRPIGAAP